MLALFSLLLAACEEEENANRPYEKLNDVKISSVANKDLQNAKNVTYEQLLKGDVKKDEIIKINGETTTINDDPNDDNWDKLTKGDQFELSDLNSNSYVVRNEDDSFKDPIGKKVTVYATFVGVDKEKLSEDDKKAGLTAEKVPLLVAYKVEKRNPSKEEIANDQQVEETLQEDASNSAVQDAINNALGEKTNTGKKRIVKFEMNDNLGTKEEDKIAVITLEGDENLTNKMTKEGMLEDSTKVFPLIFENSEASEVVLSWRYPLVDKYGNKSEEIVYKIDLIKDTNDKINWDNFDFNNFKNVADQYWEHPALSNK
jgi:hypothetical protein